MKIYRIRHKRSGLFATSGNLYNTLERPNSNGTKFRDMKYGNTGLSRHGKIWKTLGHVKAAIKYHYVVDEKTDYLEVIRSRGYVLIEYDLGDSAGEIISE